MSSCHHNRPPNQVPSLSQPNPSDYWDVGEACHHDWNDTKSFHICDSKWTSASQCINGLPVLCAREWLEMRLCWPEPPFSRRCYFGSLMALHAVQSQSQSLSHPLSLSLADWLDVAWWLLAMRYEWTKGGVGKIYLCLIRAQTTTHCAFDDQRDTLFVAELLFLFIFRIP